MQEIAIAFSLIFTFISGCILVFIGLFGGEISYKSKGAIPQIREFSSKWRARKQAEEDMKMLMKKLDDEQQQRRLEYESNRLFPN